MASHAQSRSELDGSRNSTSEEFIFTYVFTVNIYQTRRCVTLRINSDLTTRNSAHKHRTAMSDSDRPSLSPQSESFGEEASYPEPPSPESSNSSNSIITLYKPPTFLSFLRTTAINLILPFINGVMLGFGEIFAHELAFRWGWRGTKVTPKPRLSPGPELDFVC
jgi:hypothetical protein